MSHILQIDASLSGAASVSRRATAQIVRDLDAAHITHRDLAASPLPLIDTAWTTARLVAPEDQTPVDRASLALSDTLLAELEAADTIVIGLPVFNFGMPASLKAWVDLVARPRRSFVYTPDGPKGLLTGKRAIIAMASGGTQIGSPGDFASTHLTFVLNFLGITDVTVVDAADYAAAQAA